MLLALGAVAFGALVVVAAVTHRRELEEFDPVVSAACTGRGSAGTRAFVPGQPHRLVGARMSGSGWTLDSFRLPAALRATEARNTDVVVCFGDEVTQTLETCSYSVSFRGTTTPREYPRTVTRVPVRLVSALTGQTLAEDVLQGVTPPTCDSQASTATSTPSAFHVQGPSVGVNEVQAWLQSPAAHMP